MADVQKVRRELFELTDNIYDVYDSPYPCRIKLSTVLEAMGNGELYIKPIFNHDTVKKILDRFNLPKYEPKNIMLYNSPKGLYVAVVIPESENTSKSGYIYSFLKEEYGKD
ncbi:MAG: hypothetical protein ACLFQX_05750 [Candidatus Kapaibacterium sp.]